MAFGSGQLYTAYAPLGLVLGSLLPTKGSNR